MARPKNTKAILLTEECMANAMSHDQIVAVVSKAYGVGPRQIANYIMDIRARWMAEEEELRPIRRAEFRALIRQGFQDAKAAGEHGAAASYTRVMAKFDGLEAPTQIQVSGQVNIKALSPAERRAEIDALLARRREVIDGTQAGAVQVLAPGETPRLPPAKKPKKGRTKAPQAKRKKAKPKAK